MGRSKQRIVRRVVALSSLMLAGWPAQALADTSPPPPGNYAAVSVYIEMVPTATGSKPTGGTTRKPRAHLPARVQRRINREGGADAPVLKQLATSPGYGAPQQTIQIPPRPAQTQPAPLRTTQAPKPPTHKTLTQEAGPRAAKPTQQTPRRQTPATPVLAPPRSSALSALSDTLAQGSGRLVVVFVAGGLLALGTAAAAGARRRRS
jgi:hypothetical protein